jgi:hypothetical protein
MKTKQFLTSIILFVLLCIASNVSAASEPGEKGSHIQKYSSGNLLPYEESLNNVAIEAGDNAPEKDSGANPSPDADYSDVYYTTADAEYYLTSDELLFIRPGLGLEILDVVIPADRHTEVTFRLTNSAGSPLDRLGMSTPGPVSTSFILSYIPAFEESYVAYTTRVQTSPDTQESAIQATTDSGGTYSDLGDGTYMYKFGTIVPEDYDTDATHTLGMYARRDLTEFNLDRYVANELDHFVPSGSSAPEPRSIVTTETCNGRCHDPLAIHGGSRQKVGLCILCHNATQDIDPDTGNSIDMPLMVHKIHMGANLTEGYTIVGYRQSVHDYSHVEYPAPINACEDCHTGGTPTENFPMVATPAAALVCDSSGAGETTLSWEHTSNVAIYVRFTYDEEPQLFTTGGPTGSAATGKWVRDGTQFDIHDLATRDLLQTVTVDASVFGCVGNAPGTPRGIAGVQHTNWMDRPSRKTCGSCHDYIDWETGEGHSDFNIVQVDDNTCDRCHEGDSGEEFDRSVKGSHTQIYRSVQLPGVVIDLMEITDTNPGEKPTVKFSAGSKSYPINPANMNRLRFSISGPNEDFDYYHSETVGTKAVADGDNWTYTFEAPLPTDAMGSYTLGVEGRNIIEMDFGEGDMSDEEDQAENSILAFAVTDSEADARREIVSDYKCESCHSTLSLHGDNRKNVNYCDTCHQPGATDAAVRPEDQLPSQTIHMKYMIHSIHRGEDLENGYVVYGYRSSLHDYGHVEYPGDLRNCEACHINDSQQVPTPDGLLPTITDYAWWSPMYPDSAACLSCHDDDDSAVHAWTNTAPFGESCGTCHGEGKPNAVDKVHAR